MSFPSGNGCYKGKNKRCIFLCVIGSTEKRMCQNRHILFHLLFAVVDVVALGGLQLVEELGIDGVHVGKVVHVSL